MAALKLFGEYRGEPVYLIKLANENIQAEFISFGASIRSIKVKDRQGHYCDVCLGYDRIEDYAAMDGYIGATVGRHANRIGDSRFILNGKEYRLSANEGNNQLHGGIEGFSHKLWSFCCTENSVTFSIDSPDGDEGYPGNLHAELTYFLDDIGLRLEYKAKSDTDTIVNLTNHAYFNLSGHDSGEIYDHTLFLGADEFTVSDSENIPTGEIRDVEGTELDFRCTTKLKDRILCPELRITEGLDHNFVLSSSPAAVLYSPKSGIEMVCTTSLEGIQVYSSGFLSDRTGKDGAIYKKHHALCLETQHFPDAINKAHFPSPVLKAGEEYSEWTRYSFCVK